jgi:hypothetical protein
MFPDAYGKAGKPGNSHTMVTVAFLSGTYYNYMVEP